MIYLFLEDGILEMSYNFRFESYWKIYVYMNWKLKYKDIMCYIFKVIILVYMFFGNGFF